MVKTFFFTTIAFIVISYSNNNNTEPALNADAEVYEEKAEYIYTNSNQQHLNIEEEYFNMDEEYHTYGSENDEEETELSKSAPNNCSMIEIEDFEIFMEAVYADAQYDKDGKWAMKLDSL